MSLEFRQVTMHFDPSKYAKQRLETTAVFPSNVRRAEALLKGFNIGYTEGDHHIWRLEVDADIARIDKNTVTVGADYLIRDSSGHIDDRFGGWIQIVVIADLA